MPRTPSNPALHWTEVLTGLSPERVTSALERVASWGFEPLSSELLLPTIDAAVASTFLVEGFDKLVEHGANEAQLRKKIRQDREVWGTWAEVRAADILLRSMPEAELHIEDGRSKGAHADLRFLLPNDSAVRSVEVKAVGLSDEEVSFCQRMAPKLRSWLPNVGLCHVHAELGAAAPQRPRQIRTASHAESKRRAKSVPRFPHGLRGAVVVGRGSEASYARRVAGRVVQAVRQLPPGDECWVAILWSNGAPMTQVHAAIPWKDIPDHVTGIVLVGNGVAFPHREIHVYTYVMHRDADPHGEIAMSSLDGPEMERLAGLVHERFQRSSGVRPTLLKGGQRTVMFRDGRRRILPFNLLFDADPSSVARAVPAST